MSNEILFSLMQVVTQQHYLHELEKLNPSYLILLAQLHRVLETCNENAKSIQCLNTTILEFMRQMQMMGMVTRSPEIKGQTLADETNPSHVMEQKLLHFQKAKNLAQDFHVSGAPKVSFKGQMNGETHLMAKTCDWEINSLNI